MDFYLLLLLLPLFLLPILLLLRPRRRLPPSPFALPIIGHLHLLSAIPHQSLHRLSLRLGPLLSLRLGSVPCVVASSAATARLFLKTHEASFSDRPQSKAIRYLTYNSSDFSFAPYGPYWRFIKNLCVSDLLGGRTLDHHLAIRRQEQLHFLTSIHTKAERKLAVDVREELMQLTNNVICRMTMSRSCTDSDGGAGKVRHLVEEIEELMGRFNLADYIGFCKNFDLQGFDKRLEDVHRRFDEMMEGILAEKTAASAAPVKDLLDILLEISEDDGAEVKLTRENIKAFILDMFAAGTETSAITMEWALAELINHPGIMNKVRNEIEQVVGNSRVIEEADIGNLPYMEAVVKETLRLHPTGPMIARLSSEDCRVDGYDIPAKTTVFVNVWAIGRDAEQWQEPLEFKPERFLGSGIDYRGQHYQMLPFGSGRRSCPGTALAMLVVVPALGGMIQCFEWKAKEGGVVDMEEGPGLTMPRANPLVCTAVPRLNPVPLTV